MRHSAGTCTRKKCGRRGAPRRSTSMFACSGPRIAMCNRLIAPERSVRTCVYDCFFFQAEAGIRDLTVTGVQTCALPIFGKLGDIDTCSVSLRTKSGALIQINNSRRCVYGYDQRIEAFGSNGMLQAGNQYATSVESWGAEHTGAREPVLHFFIERYRQAYTSEVDSFV